MPRTTITYATLINGVEVLDVKSKKLPYESKDFFTRIGQFHAAMKGKSYPSFEELIKKLKENGVSHQAPYNHGDFELRSGFLQILSGIGLCRVPESPAIVIINAYEDVTNSHPASFPRSTK